MSEFAGWIAFYNGKQLEITKDSIHGGIYEAKQHAIKEWKVRKTQQHLVHIEPAYDN